MTGQIHKVYSYNKNCALLVIDVQYDFLPGGSLEVPEAEFVIEEINGILPQYSTVVVSQDWHPKHHISFASYHNKKPGETVMLLGGIEQRLWPDHCVQHTRGAQISEALKLPREYELIKKGQKVHMDGYSAFFDNDKQESTGLHNVLSRKKIQTLDVCGLALDVCVAATAFDAAALGYKTRVLSRASAAVDIAAKQDLFSRFALKQIAVDV